MSVNKELETQSLIYPQYINAVPVEDEISLIDLWIALLKFKKVFIASFLVLLFIGALIITLFKSDSYQMSTTIEIGKTGQGGQLQDLQPPSVLVSQLNLSRIPGITRQFSEKHGIDLFETSVTNPKNTSMVTIQNKVKETDQEIFTELHQTIAESVVEEHKLLAKVLNAQLEQQLSTEKLALQKLKDPRELSKLTDVERISLQQEKINLLKLSDPEYVKNQQKRLQDRIDLLEGKIKKFSEQNRLLNSQLESIQAQNGNAEKRTLLLENLTLNDLRIAEAEEKKLAAENELADYLFEIGLKAEKQKMLVKSLQSEIELIESNWNIAIEQKQTKVNELENQLSGNSTRVISLAELSLEPVGLTKKLAYILCVVLAFFGAFFLMLLVIFQSKVKEKMAMEA